MRVVVFICVLIFCMGKSYAQNFAYVVDTININNPHKAFIEKAGSLITIYFDGEQLDCVKKGSLKELINNEQIYFTAIDFYSFFKPSSIYEKSPSSCDVQLTKVQTGDIEISKVSGVNKYVLCLINISYFNEKQSSVDHKPWKTSLDKGVYIKVVFPYCK